MDCDGFFTELGIPFLEAFADEAVRAVYTADFYDPSYKKWLIICWFDTTYGTWTGSRFALNDSRAKMSEYLAQTTYSSFEELLDAPELPT